MNSIEIHEPKNQVQPKPFEHWTRLPNKPGEKIQGFSRAGVYGLINAGLIRTAVIRQPGKTTGIRLIWEQSLVDYIERHVTVTGELAEGGVDHV